MKKGKDFIYEYSDLNLFQTRVKILTGKFKGVILEFGGSGLAQHGDNNTFTFEYTLYEKPPELEETQLRGNAQFEKYLADLLVSVIGARNRDKKEHSRLMDAASSEGVKGSKIKVAPHFYPDWLQTAKKQPIAQGLQEI